MNRVYITNEDNTARFVLGEGGDKPLFVIGLNPSTATDIKDDPTVRRIRSISKAQGYDGWLLFNLYPLRATNPKDLPVIPDYKYMSMNDVYFEEHLKKYNYPSTVWCAWGNNIERREYLSDCARRLMAVATSNGAAPVFAGELTKNKHPRHPLYLRGDVGFTRLTALTKGEVI